MHNGTKDQYLKVMILKQFKSYDTFISLFLYALTLTGFL